MRNFLEQIAGYAFLILFLSCSNGDPGNAKKDTPLPKSGVIHENIACAGDPGHSYALYIPGKFLNLSPRITKLAPPPVPSQKGRGEGGNHLYPVIISFDPHGDGKLPLTLYKDLAEKYGFILIGSNDSKNGLSGEVIKGIVLALMHEIRTLYPVDTSRIYLLGFSGGARVAATVAMYDVKVKGVFGCGAGFGSATDPIRYKFDYFGCVGTADFNMNEMLQLAEPMSRAGFRHFIATFPGNHAWPPADVLEDGFIWATLNAMKDGLIKKDDVYISAVMTFFEYRINDLILNNQLLAAADSYRELIAFMEGLARVTELNEMQDSLEKDPGYQSQYAHRLKVMKQEEAEKQELVQALQAQDLDWWNNRIAYYALKNGYTNPEDTLKNRRLMAFLSLFCYMNANAAITQQNETAAIKIIAIYEMADAANPEPNYMRAMLLARRSENEAAFAQLKIAVKKGFTDKLRLKGQPEFRTMNSSREWFDLLKSMK